MYSYLPMVTYWTNASVNWDSVMYEANCVVFHKSEYTRITLKWFIFDKIFLCFLSKNFCLKRALLCAATQECIEPTSSVLYCNLALAHLDGVCHRQDQSVLNILNVNSEYQRWSDNKGNLNYYNFSKKIQFIFLDQKFLPHFHKDHPRRKIKHHVQRKANLDPKIDFKKAVACC